MSGRVPTVVEIADTPVDQLPPLMHVPPLTKPFDIAIRPPGSKSLTNRALLLAALAEGTSTIRQALTDADDAQVMLRAIQQLGARVERPDPETLRITGVAGRWKIPAGQTVTLNLNNAGTATRFLAAAAILAPAESGGVIIDGNARMRERPIGELAQAMNVLTDPQPCVHWLGAEGFPPLRIDPSRAAWASGMVQSFGRTQSSQFVSALMLTAPFLPYGMEIVFTTDDVTSRAYIEMTLGLLRAVGVTAVDVAGGGARIAPGERDVGGGRRSIRGFEYTVEPDASGATYLLAAAAFRGGSTAVIQGLDTRPGRSLQGDAAFAELLEAMGASVQRTHFGTRLVGAAIRSIDRSLSDMPDTAMTAAVVACFADGPSTIRGLRTLRVKETDRIAALVTELAKIGVKIEPFADGNDEAIRITPPGGGVDCSPGVPRVEFDTYDDHRMAMSLALIGLRRPNVHVREPGCVRKTYPTFWRDLARLYQ